MKKRFSKEEWFNLSEKDREYYTQEFNERVHNLRVKTIIATRIIAIFFIIGLFFIGFSILKSYHETTRIYDEYGPYAHCYLCGLNNVKTCSCYYQKTFDYGNFKVEYNLTEIRERLAFENSQTCKPYDQYIKEEIEKLNSTGLIIAKSPANRTK